MGRGGEDGVMARDGNSSSSSNNGGGDVTLRLPLEDARRVRDWLDGLPYPVRHGDDAIERFDDALGEAVHAAELEGAMRTVYGEAASAGEAGAP